MCGICNGTERSGIRVPLTLLPRNLLHRLRLLSLSLSLSLSHSLSLPLCLPSSFQPLFNLLLYPLVSILFSPLPRFLSSLLAHPASLAVSLVRSRPSYPRLLFSFSVRLLIYLSIFVAEQLRLSGRFCAERNALVWGLCSSALAALREDPGYAGPRRRPTRRRSTYRIAIPGIRMVGTLRNLQMPSVRAFE